MTRPTTTIAKNESCRITRTSSDFEFLTGTKHEVYDRERGEKLSSWTGSEALLDRLEEVDHRLADDFREWYEEVANAP